MTEDQDAQPGVTVPLDAPATSLVRRILLEVIEGPDRGTSYAASAERIVVGTKSSADLILTDSAVSRYHCALTLRGTRVEIEDLDSRNGTRVDGIQISLAWLDRDATIAIGSTRLAFRLAEDMFEIELSPREQFGELVGRSRQMRAVFAQCERAAGTETTVLLQGETGTGKDGAAVSIHLESARRDGPFVVVDCGSIPPQLVESHLFGHEAGAFTGATATRIGVFEAARGGTLFLDEIGELPLELQPKLLRALEARTIRRVGGVKDIPIDIRIIAATNRDLQREVNAKRFRSDLYYRLAVVEIRLPPLRQRREDLPLLVEHLLRAMDATGPGADQLRSAPALHAIAQHPWPGNVRELRNHLERSLAFEEPAPLAAAPGSQTPPIDPKQPLRVAREHWIKFFERQYVEAILRDNAGNVSRAARAAGIARAHFYRLLSRAGIAAQSR